MEKWDLYDNKFKNTGIVINANEEIPDGKYHYSVNIWIINSNKQLDTNEIIQNYECRYLNIYELKNILEENKKTTKETNSALDDMLLIWNEFMKQYKG